MSIGLGYGPPRTPGPGATAPAAPPIVEALAQTVINTLYYKELLTGIYMTNQLNNNVIMRIKQLNIVVCLVFLSEIEWDLMYNRQQLDVHFTEIFVFIA